MRIKKFEDWLIQEGRSAATAGRYMSHVGAVLQSTETAQRMISDPEGAKRTILQHEAALSSSQKCPFRSALRAFDAFLVTNGHPSICPKFPDGRAALPAPPQEHPLSPLLARLAREALIPWPVVEGLKWKHVRGVVSADFWFLDDPGDHRGYRAPSEVLRQINLWAGGGRKPPLNTPLVPREPLSLFPMPAAMLRVLARG